MSDRLVIDALEQLPEVEAAELMESRMGRVVYAALGFVFLGIGIAGTVLPGLPGTVFLLAATWFFFKSSEKMYLWVLNHRRLGPTVRAYRAGYGIRRRIKIYAITLMSISVAYSVVFAIDSMPIRDIHVALALVGATVILTRPTTEDVLAAA